MATQRVDTDRILPVARQILEILETVETSAKSELARTIAPEPRAVLDGNFTNGQIVAEALWKLSAEKMRELQRIVIEPAIARIVAIDENENTILLFVCRAAPPAINVPGVSVINYRAPMGRLASFDVGDGGGEISLPRGRVYWELSEKAAFTPVKSDGRWDSKLTVFQFEDAPVSTTTSLIALLSSRPESASNDDIVSQILEDERREKKVTEGITRTIIERMGLRDQPILDKIQDEIFRLPISKQLVLLGPAGTGKTTTLIRRLGQKLDWEHLDEMERRVVENSSAGRERHRSSWLMFTPTDLLKAYLKEAFSIEGIPASDERIATWSDYRNDLARNRLKILKTPNAGGRFILRESRSHVSLEALTNLSDWFDDFRSSQDDQYWSGIEQSIAALEKSRNVAFSDAGIRARRTLEGQKGRRDFEMLLRLGEIATGAQHELGKVRSRIELDVRTEFSNFLKADRTLLDELAKFLSKLDDSTDEADETEDEAESLQRQKGSREAAFDAFQQAMFTLARAKYLKRTIGPTTRAGRISAWLGQRQISSDKLLEIGQAQDDILNLRVLISPIARYLNGIPARYQAFRAKRTESKKWYASAPNSARDICAQELDLILLAHLRVAGQMLSDPQIHSIPDEQMPAALRSIKREHKSQILVDEVTDFSCIEIASMRCLCDPSVDSFMACGDFNQRLTSQGVKTDTELEWAIGKYENLRINTVYRQTRQLAEFARMLALDVTIGSKSLSLPPNTNIDGVDPVFGKNLKSVPQQATWLSERITEVQHLTRTLPSIAVLVNSERHVKPIADELHKRLVDQNIEVEACVDGKFVGNEGRVRVFDVRHIKGLEFEAVFFLDLDELAQSLPQLFDRYLYVGATRAATYLGVTTGGSSLPTQISNLSRFFKEGWP